MLLAQFVAGKVEAMKTILVICAVLWMASFAVGQTMNRKANRNSGVEQELRVLKANGKKLCRGVT